MLIGFRPSLDGSGFAAERPDFDEFGRAYAHDLGHGSMAFSWLSGAGSQALVA
jgi:hypothetical protein